MPVIDISGLTAGQNAIDALISSLKLGISAAIPEVYLSETAIRPLATLPNAGSGRELIATSHSLFAPSLDRFGEIADLIRADLGIHAAHHEPDCHLIEVALTTFNHTVFSRWSRSQQYQMLNNLRLGSHISFSGIVSGGSLLATGEVMSRIDPAEAWQFYIHTLETASSVIHHRDRHIIHIYPDDIIFHATLF